MSEAAKLFIETILAELVAGVLLILMTGLLSKRARWVLTGVLGRLLDIDVDYVFRRKEDADSDIREEISRASFLYLLTGRGSELQRETFADALSASSKKVNFKFRVLLPETNPTKGQPNWTEEREAEVAAFDPAFGKGILRDQIDTNAKFLSRYITAGGFELRRFNYPHIGRILITDRAAYFTPYRQYAHGRNSPVIKYRRGGEMYDFFLRLFDQLWGAGFEKGNSI